MERREFLKVALGFAATAGAIVAAATAAQGAPMLPQAGDAPPGGKPAETAVQPEAAKNKSDGGDTSVASSDTDMSSQYWRRRRRRYWRRARRVRRRFWRRSRRVFYY